MKKTFEFILVLFIFYGAYALFTRAADYFFDDMETALVVLVSFIFSAILLFVYRLMLTHEVKNKMKGEVHSLHNALKEKDEVIKKAVSFKEDLVAEAEKSISAE